jgi:hypothetical protein
VTWAPATQPLAVDRRDAFVLLSQLLSAVAEIVTTPGIRSVPSLEAR